LWLHSLKVAQLLRSATCLHTNQSRSYFNHLVNAVYCQNKAEHINTLGAQNAELLVLNLAVHDQPLGCKGLPNVQQTFTVVYDIKLQDTV